MQPAASPQSESPETMSGCPFHPPVGLPLDGTPLQPSPTLAEWREAGEPLPFLFPSGPAGWIVTAYDQVRDVLASPDFEISLNPTASGPLPDGGDPFDDDAIKSLSVGNPMALNGAAHTKIRRTVTGRFSVKAAQSYRERIQEIVDKHVSAFVTGPKPADVFDGVAEPIANEVHCEVLGIAERYRPRYNDLFTGSLPRQRVFDLLREILRDDHDELDEGVLGDIARAPLTRNEAEGLAYIMMVAGRDSVAYMITTSLVALLLHPDQLQTLRNEPELIPTAVEEFLRFGTIFVALFPRRPVVDVEVNGVAIAAAQPVAVSPVSANRDSRQFPAPDVLDVRRDAQGHMGFGFGAHGCIGQQVARVEVAETIRAILAAAPDLSLVHASQLEPLAFAHEVGSYRPGALEVTW